MVIIQTPKIEKEWKESKLIKQKKKKKGLLNHDK
jgi:hypothetical protein